MRMLSIEELTHRVLPYLKAAGVVGDPVHDSDAQLLELAMPLVAERMNKLTEAVDMLGFLFVDEADFERHDEIDDAGRDVVRAAHDALAGLRALVDRRDRGGAARRRWSRGWGSSRGSRSGRSGSR